jgi:hypothetical protein
VLYIIPSLCILLLDAYFSICYHIFNKGRVVETACLKNSLRVVPSTICEFRDGATFFYQIIKSYLACLCVKAIIATSSRPNVKIQLSASKVTILSPPHEASRPYTVMRCAKQRDYSPIHILPHSTQFVYIKLEVIIIFCKFTPLFIDRFYTIRQTQIYRGIAR